MESNLQKIGNAFGVSLGVILAVFAALTLAYVPFKAITSSGQVDYCYTRSISYHAPSQADVVVYDLWGFRSWRQDRIIAQNLKSMDEVREAATKYECKLK